MLLLRDCYPRPRESGGLERLQSDPHWRDCLLFPEDFHGDNGANLWVSLQTGWTGLVTRLIQQQEGRSSS
jgi:hypothetical protein